MIKLTQIIFLGFFFVMSCQKPGSSDSLIEEEKFVQLLVEIYITEARLSNAQINRDSAIRLFVPYEDELFQKYQISEAQLKQTYRYYIDHPDEFGKIYDIVIDSLSLRHQKLEAAGQ